MAALFNQTANLRLHLGLVRRLSDGVLAPASLEMNAAIERYRHQPELGFAPILAVERATLLDLDLIQFLESLEAMLEGADQGGEARTAALEASVEPSVAIRIGGGPEAFQVEVGIDLLHVLEPVAGDRGERGSDLLLVRFFANGRAVLAFCDGLLAEFARFPTDPSKVAKGAPD